MEDSVVVALTGRQVEYLNELLSIRRQDVQDCIIKQDRFQSFDAELTFISDLREALDQAN